MESACSQSPQQCYRLHRMPTNNHPLASRIRLVGTNHTQRQAAALVFSNTTSRQAPAPSTFWEPIPLSTGKCLAGPAAGPDPRKIMVCLQPFNIHLFHIH